MPTTTQAFSRDGNGVPITDHGLLVDKEITFSADNETLAVPLFTVTGDVRVKALYGIVTTVMGSNNTGGYFRLNDQTAQSNITLDTGGATLSSMPVGSIIMKDDLVSVVAEVHSAAAGVVDDPVYAGSTIWCEFEVLAKATATTNIEYVYTTNQSPTTGAIKFYCGFIPVSENGNVTAV